MSLNRSVNDCLCAREGQKGGNLFVSVGVCVFCPCSNEGVCVRSRACHSSRDRQRTSVCVCVGMYL